jgi:signal transduction histidine kinase
MNTASPEPWVRRLLDVGRSLVTELDLEVVLARVLQTARELTGARYAALGILDQERSRLERFLTSGIDRQTRSAIGEPPRGRGVLGELIQRPHALRLADVREHPNSYGFPPGHPVMRSFLGVPILIRGDAWGNLYLTEKEGGEFTEQDVEAAVILADWAAVAIENARLYETSEHRRFELERAVRGLEASHHVTIAIGGDIGLAHVLDLIVKRGRALLDATSLVIMLRERGELVVRASAGAPREVHGLRVSIDEAISGQPLRLDRPERLVESRRINDLAARLGLAGDGPAAAGTRTAMLVPMIYRGDAVGVLVAFDRGEDAGVFDEEDENMLRTFAASAATAVALAQSVQTDRLRASLAAADDERRHWARELHDETLQGLGGLRVLLSSALRSEDPQRASEAMREAVEHIEREIENLRAIITELRPAALDELGLRTAIEALLDRHREQSGFAIEDELSLPGRAPGEERLDGDVETAVYRLVQEALTNVAKHARASSVRVCVRGSGEELLIEVQDDGLGFDVEEPGGGFGLAGMHERVSLAGGTLKVESGATGTLVRARLPRSLGEPGGDPGGFSGSQQAPA